MLLLVFRHDAHVKLISYTDLPGTDAELLDLGTNLFYLKRTLHGLSRNCMSLLVFRHGAHVNLISYTDLPGTDPELLDL
ncbi:hypothetical protein H0E87_009343, partial [Populus deltoides]